MRRRLSKILFRNKKEDASAGAADSAARQRTSPTSKVPPQQQHHHQQRTTEDWIRSMLDTYGTICSTNDESEYSMGDLSAALEHSRRVMDEEKLKFQKLWLPSRRLNLSPNTTKISPISARNPNGGGLSAAMIFREGPINDMNLSPLTTTKNSTTAAPRYYTVTASPGTMRNKHGSLHTTSESLPFTSIDALLLKDPNLCRLLRIHRHSANQKTSRRRRREYEVAGHKRAKSSPEINWGGMPLNTVLDRTKNVQQDENDALTYRAPPMTSRHALTEETPLPTAGGGGKDQFRFGTIQAATSPTAALVSPYANTDSVSPIAGSLASNYFAVQPPEPSNQPSCPMPEPDENCLIADDATPLSNKAKIPVPLHIDLPCRSQEVNLERHGYSYVSFLSEGSLGKLQIVRSRDNLLWVAKLVDLALLRNPADAAEALLEAELLRRLRHPNVVEYRNSFIEDEHLVIIMEYCVNGDLHGHLLQQREKGELISEQQVIRWIYDICAGLNHMHKNNVLHCDVKSSNVFLSADCVAKIGDLGIAREIRRGAGALSPLRCPRGTPLYMSPEMCSKAALTERSDCWAVGCILYEICHFHHAFGSNLHVGSKAHKDNESINSGHSGGTFLPGMTHRSDLSIVCKNMLKNIKGDLKRIKLNADAFKFREDEVRYFKGAELHYWSKGGLSIPQILPERYGPLLNYLVCAMLEPRPSDRPTLKEIMQLIALTCSGYDPDPACSDEESVPDEKDS